MLTEPKFLTKWKKYSKIKQTWNSINDHKEKEKAQIIWGQCQKKIEYEAGDTENDREIWA
jgi:hypothetical protein